MTKKILATSMLWLMTLAMQGQVLETYQGVWSGTLKAGGIELAFVVNIDADDKGTPVCTFDSPDQGAKGIPGQVDHLSLDSLRVSCSRLGLTYSGHRDGDSIVGQFVQMLSRIPLTLHKGAAAPLVRPQMPQPPFPYESEEVTFTNESAGATFSGTLTYPVGFHKKKLRKTPVVLMVTGSGQQNRDEELMEHKPFLVIADHLARHGIAALRYDDRGYGKSTGGRLDSITTADNALDAESGIRFLRKKGFKRIGVLGHSEGGNIAFILGARGTADFLVSLAGVGVKGDTALAAQYNKTMELSQLPERKTTKEYVEYVHQTMNSPWLNHFLDYDPASDLSSIHCPVMALNGDKDCQVLSKLNLEGIRQHLPKNKKHVIKEYTGLNHLFQHCTTGDVNEYRKIEETISPEVLDDIVGFILRL